MKVIYPSLVEQSFDLYVKRYGTVPSNKVNKLKSHIYSVLVRDGVLKQNGEPTQKAKDDGLVESFTPNEQGEYEPESVRDLKLMYPMYAQFSDNHFMKSGQGWLADAYVIRSVANQILNDSSSDEEQRQSAYQMLAQLDK
ncbi:hypothetical protein EFE25_02685 [Levilactobacillus brevis]|uniref:Uncharacterized protein n=2 Tax=Levilactobacillus brevis TaxID=1580 RepID=A0AB38X4N6_LEVBR|nr:hypothetical protein [Levilactobacillus brevis]MCB5232832.1 hypothetical protein [Levilactobacillus brevis]MCS8596634.1 hypothetical protein [Levilactobacillus brevis]MCT3564278.1 hypothetical protein [Levilactobacillus brevis]MCT3599343.1 hypothetical protein [Levilactobacillus brevis]MCX7510460.1 hypothetical protein [Levilactobacillus brevis]